MSDAVLTGLHHLLALALVATLATELTLVTREMSAHALRLVLRVHLVYLLLFVSMIAVGLLRAALSAQGLAHYLADPVFALKMAALALALLTNVPASRTFYRWHRLSSALPGVVPRLWEIRNVRHWLHAGAIAFVAVPMLAAFLARPAG